MVCINLLQHSESMEERNNPFMKTKDLIGFPEEWTNKSKLHFAIGAKNRHEPLYEFYKNEFQDWQNSQNNKTLSVITSCH